MKRDQFKNTGNKPPKVTIAIPTYNRSFFLQQCISSALNQTYTNIEVIVSDNASTDDTLSLLSQIRNDRLIVLHQSSNVGMMANWNICLARASGDFFILLSDDDYLETTAIEKMIAGFLRINEIPALSSNDIGIVCCRAKVVDENNKEIQLGRQGPFIETSEDSIIAFFSGLRDMYPCKILFRTSDAREIEGYQGVKFPLSADAFMWMTIALTRGYVVFIDEILSNYRVHSGAATQQTIYRVWMKEINDLRDSCINFLHLKSKPTNIEKIQEAAALWNCRLITASLIKSLIKGTSKSQAISELMSYHALFITSRKGIFLFFRGMIRILLPQKFFFFLKIMRRTTILGAMTKLN